MTCVYADRRRQRGEPIECWSLSQLTRGERMKKRGMKDRREVGRTIREGSKSHDCLLLSTSSEPCPADPASSLVRWSAHDFKSAIPPLRRQATRPPRSKQSAVSVVARVAEYQRLWLIERSPSTTSVPLNAIAVRTRHARLLSSTTPRADVTPPLTVRPCAPMSAASKNAHPAVICSNHGVSINGA